MAQEQDRTRAWVSPSARTATAFGPVARGDAYTRLKALIAHNAFRPGHHLMARDLADDLRVSATPVREALIRLSVEGAIEAVPHKGFYTKPLDAAELADSYELAFMIASHAVQKGAADFSSDGLERPQMPDPAPDAVLGLAPDVRLAHVGFVEHVLERIAGLSGNLKAAALIKSSSDRTRLIRMIDFEDTRRMGFVVGAFGEVVASLEAGQADAAVLRLRHILEDALERLPALVKEANARALQPPFRDQPTC